MDHNDNLSHLQQSSCQQIEALHDYLSTGAEVKRLNEKARAMLRYGKLRSYRIARRVMLKYNIAPGPAPIS